VIGDRKSGKLYANRGMIAETYANLGCLGMMLLKPTPIWDVYGRGRGGKKSVDLVIARDPVIGNLANPTPIRDGLGW
jgi:hypothetical protein